MLSARARLALNLLLVTGVGIALGSLAPFFTERSAYDHFLTWKLGAAAQRRPKPLSPEEAITQQVVMIDISTPESRHLAATSRAELARIIQHLGRFNPGAIAMDMYFLPDRNETPEQQQGTAALREAIRERKVVLGTWYDESGQEESIPIYSEEAGRLGCYLLSVDDDRVLRHVKHLYDGPGIRGKQSLSLAVLCQVLDGTGGVDVEVDSSRMKLKPVLGNSIALSFDDYGRTPIYYRGVAQTIPVIHYTDMLRLEPPEKDPVAQQVFFVGNPHTDISDAYDAPIRLGRERMRVERMAGMECHAQNYLSLYEAVSRGEPLWRFLHDHEQVLMLALAGLLGGVITLNLPVGWAVLLLLFASALTFLGSIQLLDKGGLFVDPFGPLFAVLGAGTAAVVIRNRQLVYLQRSIEALMETYCRDEVTLGMDATESDGKDRADVPDKLTTRLLEAREILAPKGFEITGVVGGGGMSVVLRGREKKTGRDVALKLLSPDLIRDPESRARFEREARLAESLQDEHIVGVVACGHRLGIPYIAYEYVEGENLRDRLRRLKRMPYPAAVAAARQVLEGLASAHARGIIHRDIKPENLMLTPKGQVRILDFGIARASKADDAFKTRVGIVLGTPAYMAPELVRGRGASPASDIYALGISLYEMISGRAPFSRDSVSVILVSHLEKEVPSLRNTGHDIPAELQQILSSMLEKNPAHRPETVLDLRNRLLPYEGDVLEEPPPEEEGAEGDRPVRTRRQTSQLNDTTSLKAHQPDRGHTIRASAFNYEGPSQAMPAQTQRDVPSSEKEPEPPADNKTMVTRSDRLPAELTPPRAIEPQKTPPSSSRRDD